LRAGDYAAMAANPQSVITWWAVASAFGGSIIGATLGGVVNFILQQRALEAAKAQRDEERAEVRKALGYSLLFKMIKLASALENMGKAVRECLAKAEAEGFTGRPFQIVTPIIPPADRVHFSPEEMALVLSLDDKVFNEIAALDELHNSTAAIVDLYGERRTKVFERFGAVMTGTLGTTGLTQADVNWLGPRAVELDGLIEAILQRSEEDGKRAWNALEHLRDLLDEMLGIKHKLEKVNQGEQQQENS
jgi:hypothetical protein